MRWLILLVTLIGAAVFGCASGDGMHTKLQDTSSAYHRHLRWGDWDAASEFMPREARAHFLELSEEVGKRLVIVDYEVTRLFLDKATGVATARVELSWHTDDRLIVEATTVDTVWQWHEGGWVLVDERRTAGTPLALFADRAEEIHPYLPGLDAYRKTHEIGKEQKRAKGRKGGGGPSTVEAPQQPTDLSQMHASH